MKRKFIFRKSGPLRSGNPFRRARRSLRIMNAMLLFMPELLYYMMLFLCHVIVVFAKLYKMLFIVFWKYVKWVFNIREKEKVENEKEKSRKNQE